MQYAISNGERSEAFKGGHGLCPVCGGDVIAKCGTRIIPHWAHARRLTCDPWWEPETPWHRQWKSEFPEDFREVAHTAPDGEIHRSDIKTSTGIVIEVQHSPMSDVERLSRELFYKNMIWIVDGAPFANNFRVAHMLPDPLSALAADLVWSPAQPGMEGSNRGLFFRLSENEHDYPGVTKKTLRFGWIHSLHEIEQQVRQSYVGHHQFVWKRPRKAWMESTCPVFFDFRTEFLLKFERYDESGLPCIRYVPRTTFVRDAMAAESAHEIGEAQRDQVR